MPKIGYKMSDESKEKMRQAKLKNPTRYWLGKKISKEHFQKMHQARLKKAPHPALGRIVTDDQKSRISATLKRKYQTGELVSPLRKLGLIGRKGKDAMNWRGGTSLIGQNFRNSSQYKEWRSIVLKKQNFICQFCKVRGGKLQVDHVQEFSKREDLRLDVSNGRVLCVDCHRRVTAYKKTEKIDLRGAFVDTLIEIARKDERLVVITCDVGFKFLDKFAEEFPDRYFNLGITEQSSMVIAGAMALSGLRPVFYSMINFSVFRPFEMLRNIIAYHNAPVIVAGVSGSKAYRFLGLSHNISKNEDINTIWHFPNLRIRLPWTPEETKQAVITSFESNKPTYIRL